MFLFAKIVINSGIYKYFCIFVVFYFVFQRYFTLYFCCTLFCIFAVNGILMSVSKTDTVPFLDCHLSVMKTGRSSRFSSWMSGF
jgi:hypothetical protein